MLTNYSLKSLQTCLIFLTVKLILTGGDGRVTIEGYGTKFVMRGENITVICHYDRLSTLDWYNSSKHKVLAKPGQVHITASQSHHLRTSTSVLEFINITLRYGGIYSCFGGEGSFDVEILIFDVLTKENHYETNKCNLSCELTGFTHNLPKIKVSWDLEMLGPIFHSQPGLTLGTSPEKQFAWIDVNLGIHQGLVLCIFELPSPEGSFFANKSFMLTRGIISLSNDRSIHEKAILLVAAMVAVAMVIINLVCNYKSMGSQLERQNAELHDYD